MSFGASTWATPHPHVVENGLCVRCGASEEEIVLTTLAVQRKAWCPKP